LGIQPQDITDVIFSHAHDDHIMGSTIERNGQRIPTFPNARFLMMQAEWDHAAHQTHQDSAFCTHLEILENYQRLQLISDAYEVAPGIQITPSPGESPGHAIVRLDSSEQTAFYMGDLFHHPAEILHPDWMWPDRDQNQMLASRHALIDEALKTKAILIGAHFTFPGMGSLQQTGSSIQWIPIPPND
jgi:glyoxylase-like metal-dependent hydrolase (beta-lactamase superfamily II)